MLILQWLLNEKHFNDMLIYLYYIYIYIELLLVLRIETCNVSAISQYFQQSQWSSSFDYLHIHTKTNNKKKRCQLVSTLKIVSYLTYYIILYNN